MPSPVPRRLFGMCANTVRLGYGPVEPGIEGTKIAAGSCPQVRDADKTLRFLGRRVTVLSREESADPIFQQQINGGKYDDAVSEY